ncbi:MAG: hypothetical protein HY941_04655 [Gammaproteobacteria bacterium]|nr:hypothetical protein [Gammaproteobacteria bacterium]
MNRALVARLLIVFTLLANLGWVTETYMHDAVAAHASLTTLAGDPQDNCPPGTHCQHCCHAIAHLLTLPSHGISFDFNTGQDLDVAIVTHLPSFIPAPPYQPPRA